VARPGWRLDRGHADPPSGIEAPPPHWPPAVSGATATLPRVLAGTSARFCNSDEGGCRRRWPPDGFGCTTNSTGTWPQPGDRVRRVVDVRGTVAFLVGGNAGHRLTGPDGSARRPRVVWCGRAIDADLNSGPVRAPRRTKKRDGRCDTQGQGMVWPCCSPPFDLPAGCPRQPSVLMPDLLVQNRRSKGERELAQAGGCPAVFCRLRVRSSRRSRERKAFVRSGWARQRPRPPTAKQADDADQKDTRREAASLVVPRLGFGRVRAWSSWT